MLAEGTLTKCELSQAQETYSNKKWNEGQQGWEAGLQERGSSSKGLSSDVSGKAVSPIMASAATASGVGVGGTQHPQNILLAQARVNQGGEWVGQGCRGGTQYGGQGNSPVWLPG